MVAAWLESYLTTTLARAGSLVVICRYFPKFFIWAMV
jgi:hypothetical protein